MAVKKKKKAKSKTDKVVGEILEIVTSNKKAKSKKTEKSKDKAKSKKTDRSKSKAKTKKSKVKSFTTKEIKSTWKEMSFPATITTKELTKLIEEMTGYKLGEDTTAGAKNLRRYLRTLDAYDDNTMTYYRWNIKTGEDLEEISSILDYYQAKSSKLG